MLKKGSNTHSKGWLYNKCFCYLDDDRLTHRPLKTKPVNLWPELKSLVKYALTVF